MARQTTPGIGAEIDFGLPPTTDRGGLVTSTQGTFTVVYELDVLNLPAADLDTDLDGTADAYSHTWAKIPAGARIKEAFIRVTTAFAGGTNVNVGLRTKANAEIDNDGIDAAVATAALTPAGKVVVCDGALVNATSVLAADGYPVASVSGTYTAGKADLVIVYELQSLRGE